MDDCVSGQPIRKEPTADDKEAGRTAGLRQNGETDLINQINPEHSHATNQ